MDSPPVSQIHAGGRLGLLSLAALDSVFGDIGTSPLYALQAVLTNDIHPVAVAHANILGVLSLVLWSLVIVVTFKSVLLILRADHRGEGGIMFQPANRPGRLSSGYN